jgi:hypothetical protein
MAQYPLTAQQKKLLTALKSGFENKTIPDRVLITRLRNGITIRYLNANDVPLPRAWESVTSADLIAFLRWGFMATRDEKYYTFDEYKILEALQSKFNIPDPAASKALQKNVAAENTGTGGQPTSAGSVITPKTHRVALDLPADLYERIEQEAKRQNRPIETIIADTLGSTFGKK